MKSLVTGNITQSLTSVYTSLSFLPFPSRSRWHGLPNLSNVESATLLHSSRPMRQARRGLVGGRHMGRFATDPAALMYLPLC